MLTEKSGFSFIAYGTATVRFIGAATGKLCKNCDSSFDEDDVQGIKEYVRCNLLAQTHAYTYQPTQM